MITSEHQEQLLNMMRVISEFLESHGIRYYLLGGSCIGALRHKGFIPWDDDMDLMIDRNNYYKMVECISAHPIEGIELFCFERDNRWYRPFAQFSSTNDTVLKRSMVFNRGLSLGTKIDVMIIDYVPSDRLDDYVHDFLLYQELNCYAYSYKLDKVAELADEFDALAAKLGKVGRAEMVASLKDNLEQYTEEQSDKRVVRFWCKKLRDYDASWLQEPLYVEFEDLKLPVATKPEACLRYQYGFDWYMVPQQDLQRDHGFLINRNVPGREYHEHLSRYLDFDKLEALLVKIKRASVQKRAARTKLHSTWADIEVQHLLLDYDFDAIGESAGAVDNIGGDEALCEAMQAVLEQRKQFALIPPELRGVPDALVERWLVALIRLGRYYDALRIRVAFRPGYEPPMTADAPESSNLGTYAEELLDRVLRLAAAYQDGDDDDALLSAVKRFGEDEQEQVPDVILGLKKLKEDGVESPASWEDIERLVERYLDAHPNNYEIVKAQGDLLWRRDERESAMKAFEAAHANTSNGLDLLELESRFAFQPRFTGE